MEKLQSKKVWYCNEVLNVIKGLQTVNPSLSYEEIGSLDEVLRVKQQELFSYDSDFDKVRNNPILVLHSSGSTGKVLNWNMQHIG